jgi:hypothetical protein
MDHNQDNDEKGPSPNVVGLPSCNPDENEICSDKISSQPLESRSGERPTSAAKIAANRENSDKSTGPTSDEGKKRSARNSLKLGFFAQWLVLKDAALKENPDEFKRLLDEINRQYEPATFEETLRCEEVAISVWKRIRLARYEAGQIARYRAVQTASARNPSALDEALGIRKDPGVEAIFDHLLLLSKEDLTRYLRYDSLTRRQLNFAISRLETLQARRKGESGST